jgi:hypothetical protein
MDGFVPLKYLEWIMLPMEGHFSPGTTNDIWHKCTSLLQCLLPVHHSFSHLPGGTNDALAFLRWQLSKYLKDLMEAFIVLGDNASVIDYNLLTPFDKCKMGADWEMKDVYNFYFSQLRIWIEMSFGLLVNKWGILQKPLKVDISKVSHVIDVCIRLHNFCVDERMLDNS